MNKCHMYFDTSLHRWSWWTFCQRREWMQSGNTNVNDVSEIGFLNVCCIVLLGSAFCLIQW